MPLWGHVPRRGDHDPLAIRADGLSTFVYSAVLPRQHRTHEACGSALLVPWTGLSRSPVRDIKGGWTAADLGSLGALPNRAGEDQPERHQPAFWGQKADHEVKFD